MRGEFTIDSSTPTLTGNEHPIEDTVMILAPFDSTTRPQNEVELSLSLNSTRPTHQVNLNLVQIRDKKCFENKTPSLFFA
jgi:hypothetical protein